MNYHWALYLNLLLPPPPPPPVDGALSVSRIASSAVKLESSSRKIKNSETPPLTALFLLSNSDFIVLLARPEATAAARDIWGWRLDLLKFLPQLLPLLLLLFHEFMLVRCIYKLPAALGLALPWPGRVTTKANESL